MHTIRKRIFCALTAVALLASPARRACYSGRTGSMPPVWRGDPTRFQGGVLMDETFSPLPPPTPSCSSRGPPLPSGPCP
ncbi:MAG: hypothetical protein ACLSAF_06840 [Intestinimonas sp.]